MQVAVLPGVDAAALRAYLVPVLELDADAPLEIELIDGGRSNLTYSLSQLGRNWVLRRPPLAMRAAAAHSMRREFRVLSALAGSAVPVPTPVHLCDDPAVIGAEFYVMEQVEGRIVRSPGDVDFGPAAARRCSEALVETLAAIHTVPFEEVGLRDFGRPAGYLSRQLDRWHEQLDGLPDAPAGLRELGARLRGRLPESGPVGLIHGDYRLDNLVLDPSDPGRIVAVLDWEMATVGDPLADLGMLLMYWGQPGEEYPHDAHRITAAPGFFTRDEVVAAYELKTGFALTDLDFYFALAHFKLAVIVSGIVARKRAGATVGEAFADIEPIPGALTERGLEVLAS